MMRIQPRRWLDVRPLLLVLLATMLVGKAHIAEAQTANEQTLGSRKSPWAAFGLSFLLTGAGQAYNGQWVKGGLMLGGQLASLGVVIAGGDDCDFVQDGGECGLVVIGLAGVVAFALSSWIDAPMSANAINRRITGEVALQIGPRLIVPQSRSARSGIQPSGLRSLHRTSSVGLSLVRVRF